MTAESHRLVLDPLFREMRVLSAERGGWAMPLFFHDNEGGVAGSGISEEYYGARDGAAMIDLSRWELLEIRNPRTVAKLGRLLTRGAEGLGPGQSRRSAWLDDKGKVRGLLRLLAAADAVFLECPRESAVGLRRELGLDDEAPRPDAGSVAFGLLGPRGQRILADSGYELPPMSDGEHRSARVPGLSSGVLAPDGSPAGRGADIPVRALKSRDLPRGFLLYVARDQAENLWKRLLSAGAEPMGYSAFDFYRIEHGFPWYGFDIGPHCTLEEAGMRDCLPDGNPGLKPQRRLCRLFLTAVASPGDPVQAEGRDIGWITTFETGMTSGPCRAMGFIDEPWCESGTDLEVAGGRAKVMGMNGQLPEMPYDLR